MSRSLLAGNSRKPRHCGCDIKILGRTECDSVWRLAGLPKQAAEWLAGLHHKGCLMPDLWALVGTQRKIIQQLICVLGLWVIETAVEGDKDRGRRPLPRGKPASPPS